MFEPMFLDGFPGLAALVEKRLEVAAAGGELSGLPGEGRHRTASRAWHDYEAALQRRLDRAGSG